MWSNDFDRDDEALIGPSDDYEDYAEEDDIYGFVPILNGCCLYFFCCSFPGFFFLMPKTKMFCLFATFFLNVSEHAAKNGTNSQFTYERSWKTVLSYG